MSDSKHPKDIKPNHPDRRRFLLSAGAAAAGAGFVAHELATVRPAVAGEAAAPKTVQIAAAETPIGPKWWPSKWGAEDQAGASNHITPEKVMAASALIKTGKVYSLGHTYEPEMPLFGSRAFAVRIPGAPTGGVFGNNKIIWNDEFLATEIGQVGTQFDGLGHIGVQVGDDGNQGERRFYNGFSMAEMAGAYGLQKLGVENVRPIFSRGILLDIKGLKGQTLAAGTEISVADIEAALEKQGLSGSDVTAGDAVVIRTGWSDHWIKDNATYNAGAPGIGVEAGLWLGEKDVVLVGSDTWPVEVVPNPDSNLAFPVHQELITKRGIYLHENLNLEQLAADGQWQFAYVFAPVPIKGATGSPGNPIAVT